ncbi:hypothetical protein MD484_g9075, partial [Candolleomyces efflorescens]
MRVGATWSLHLPGERSFELTPKAPIRVSQVCLKPTLETSGSDRTCLAYRLASTQGRPTVISALTRGVYERDLLELELSQGVTYILYVCGLSELHVLGRYCDQVGPPVTRAPEASRAAQAHDGRSTSAAAAKEGKRKRVDSVNKPGPAHGKLLQAAPMPTYDRPAFVSTPGPSAGPAFAQGPSSGRSFPPGSASSVNPSYRTSSNHSFASGGPSRYSFASGVSSGHDLAPVPSGVSDRQLAPPVLSVATGHDTRVGHHRGLFGTPESESSAQANAAEGSFFFRPSERP